MAIGNFGSGQNRSPLSEINVTPFVDVMLVLLVIFMVTAPMLYRGININLPETSSSPVPVERHQGTTVTLTASEGIFLGDSRYRLSEIASVMADSMRAAGTDPQTEKVFIRADKSVKYGFMVEVMDEIRKTGIEKLNLVTELSDKEDLKTDM